MLSSDLKKAASSYSNTNINLLNELFYKKADKSLIDELPNLFVSLELFHEALFKKIIKVVDKDPIRVKELASGSRLGLWENFIQLNRSRDWEVVLTDFNEKILPDISGLIDQNFQFDTEVQNLFDNFQLLVNKLRYDVIFSAYAFDNIWLPQDIHLIKDGNDWFKSEFRLDLTVKEVQKIKTKSKLNKNLFRNIKIKQRKTPFHISKTEHGQLISEYYSDIKEVKFNLPSGLINKIEQVFKNQLKSDGIFITSDIAIANKGESAKAYNTVNDCIKIKLEDYGLAKFVLEQIGYKVELKSLFDFIKDSGLDTPVDIHDHYILVVKRQ